MTRHASPQHERGDEQALAGDRLDGLGRLSLVLSRARRLEDVVRTSADVARSALGAASVSLSRFSAETGLLTTLVNTGELAPWEDRFPVDETYPLGEHSAFLALRDEVGHVVRVDDDGLLPADELLLQRLGRVTALVVPLVVDGLAWGELYATRTADQPPFTDGDVSFAQVLSAQISAGIAQTTHLERVQLLAYTDQLTGLANRRAFDERLDAAIDQHLAEGTEVTVLLCDLNGLKRVNDAEGHAAGDRLLLGVAALLSAAAAHLQGALAARLGGDEFAVLVVGQPLDAVVGAGEGICRDALELRGSHGVAVGIASTSDPFARVDTSRRLLRLADAAQYRAKRGGAAAPVVAGRRSHPAAEDSSPQLLPSDTVTALQAVAPPGPEDRRTFRREEPEAVKVLVAGLLALDESRGEPPASRMEVVAETVARLVDAAGWWVSRVDAGSRELRTVSWSVHRPSATMEVSRSPHDDYYDLDVYPETRAALDGGGFELEVGAPDNDPAEESVLVTSGYTGMVAAGATAGTEGWLVEVFTDEMSTRVDGLLAVLRALVAVAVLRGDPPVAVDPERAEAQ